MNLFRTTVGIDPSGGGLAIVSVRAGVGRPAVVFPPAYHEPKPEKEPLRIEEAEEILCEYVARHGLVGAEAVLVAPAERVYLARTAFPPMKDKDFREAAGLELERLFPVSPDTLRFVARRLQAPRAGGRTGVVAAVPAQFLDRWGETVGRSGLALSAAVPAPWAAGAAIRRVGAAADPSRPFVFLRGTGRSVECAVIEGGEPAFCASRPCPPGEAPSEALSLGLSGLVDLPAPAGDATVDLFAPPSWYPGGAHGVEAGGIRFRLRDDFAGAAAALFPGTAGGEAGSAFRLLCAFGAALPGDRVDLLSTQRNGGSPGIARAVLGVSAAAAIALGVAWPATVARKTKDELRSLSARVEELRPAVRQYEETVAELDDAQGRIATLREEGAASGETLRILKELTDRLPNGTWLLSFRVEGRKVDLEGLSPSASEIFPALTRDGRFRGVEFGAPITRQADNIERFKIRGEFIPPSQSAGSPPGEKEGK